MSVYGKTHLANARATTADVNYDDDDDWEPDPDFENDQSEYEQRRGGAKKDSFDISVVRDQARAQDDMHTKSQYESQATRYGIAKREDEAERKVRSPPQAAPSGGAPGAPEW